MTDSIDASLSEEDDSISLSDRLPDRGPSPAERLASQEKQKLVREALGRLSPDLREAVILRDLQDMDYKEISQVLRVPEGTVKSRINRGRTELARLLSRNKRQASK
jgi:RNA polymerase sigma-70 factor (ECF subfamily)